MGVGDLGPLSSRVRAWVANDPDPVTVTEAETLLAAAEAGDAVAEQQLRDAFDGRLSFGTAGLRARLGAGPRRMNRVVVAQTSAGLADYVWDRARAVANRSGTAAHPSIVIGFDARANSEVFARDAAEILTGAGIAVTLFAGPVPTPVTAFAVRHLGASAGIMVTASHNPPRDNGYKVYLGGEGGGAQIVAPVDQEISDRIAARADTPIAELPRSTEYTLAGAEMVDAYVDAVSQAHSQSGRRPAVTIADAPPFTAVYTAMHGVGAATTHRLLDRLGLPAVIPVAEQEQPDGAFPTLEYPNPEEPEALNLAFHAARARGAQLVIAHDPDADRLAIAAPHPETPGEYRALSGNELGLLLGWRAAQREHDAAAHEGRTARGVLANTIVSSPALRTVAEHYGLTHTETLSGSKWLARIPGLLFGFEEALGYLTAPDVVPDKDGIAAAAEALTMVLELHAEGRTVWQLLDEASERFGHFASAQVVLRFDRMAEAEALVARVRAQPPTRFGATAVREARDLQRPGTVAVPANVLAYELADGSRVMMRPSGTEPKLKVYIDAFCDTGSAGERRASAATTLSRIEVAVRETLAGARS